MKRNRIIKTLVSGSLFLIFCLVLSAPTAFAGTIYNCIDKSGKSVLTDKPLGKDYKCTILERYKDPTPEERAAWEREREAKTAPPVSAEKPSGEGVARRPGEAETLGVEGPAPERVAQPGQPGGPRILYPIPSKQEQQPAESSDTYGAPPEAGAEGPLRNAPPQIPWGRSRYGYYPIPGAVQPQQPPQQDQQQ